jgi:hypothetical protein
MTGTATTGSACPSGVKLAKLHKFGTTPVQFTAQYEHNFADDHDRAGRPLQLYRQTPDAEGLMLTSLHS